MTDRIQKINMYTTLLRNVCASFHVIVYGDCVYYSHNNKYDTCIYSNVSRARKMQIRNIEVLMLQVYAYVITCSRHLSV